MANTNPNNIDEYKKIAEQINMNRQNAKTAIGNANLAANAYLNNALKKQGIMGSGLGQTAQAQVNTNYQNNLANMNISYDNMLNDAQNNLNTNLVNTGRTLNSSSALDKYIASLNGGAGVNQGTLDQLAARREDLATSEAQTNSANYLSQIQKLTDSNAIQQMINNANGNLNANDLSYANAYYNQAKANEESKAQQDAETKAEKEANEQYKRNQTALSLAQTYGNTEAINEFLKQYENEDGTFNENSGIDRATYNAIKARSTDVSTTKGETEAETNSKNWLDRVNNQASVNKIEQMIEREKNNPDSTISSDYLSQAEDLLADKKANQLYETVTSFDIASANYSKSSLDDFEYNVNKLVRDGYISRGEADSIIQTQKAQYDAYMKPINDALKKNGVSDYNPIDADFSTLNGVKDWVNNTFAVHDGFRGAFVVDQAEQIWDKIKDNKNGVVTINVKGTNSKVYVHDGKVYWVKKGSTK